MEADREFLRGHYIFAPDLEMEKKGVVFIHSEEILNICSHPTKIKGRAFMVHRLIEAYGLLQKLRITSPPMASLTMLESFHCKNYITCVKKIQDHLHATDAHKDNFADELADTSFNPDDYGLAYDCQPFKGIYDYMRLVAGASIRAAEILNAGDASKAINLYGGWHHAHRDSAAGFCYVNDIVLAILKLKERFNKILYIDIDIHHGDGVEEAFLTTDKVMTVSFHKLENGYFPGTGKLSDIGCGNGKYHNVNVPLREGIDDTQYFQIFSRVMNLVKEAFKPDVLVCQCGADCLAGDPLGGFNLTNKGLAKCVKYLMGWRLPSLILGGGGYNFANTAKAWTHMIASILDEDIDNDIPDHEFFAEYAPVFDINITPSVRKSCNSTEDVDRIISKISENLSKLKTRNPLRSLQTESSQATFVNQENSKANPDVQKRKAISAVRHRKRSFTDIRIHTKNENTENNLISQNDFVNNNNISQARQSHSPKLRKILEDNSKFEQNGFCKRNSESRNLKKLFEFDEDS